MSEQTQIEKPANPFLPIALVAVSIVCFLGPTAWDASQIKTNLTAARDQQATGLAQSQPIMARFQKMMMELLALSQTDADAKQIVTKYGIAVQAPPR